MNLWNKIDTRKCQETHAEKNVRARLVAKYSCARVKIEMAVIAINEALERIKDK